MHTTDARQAYTRSRSSRSGSFSEEVERCIHQKRARRRRRGASAPCAFSDHKVTNYRLYLVLYEASPSVAFSTTTLEDVFLAVGEDDAVHNGPRSMRGGSRTSPLRG